MVSCKMESYKRNKEKYGFPRLVFSLVKKQQTKNLKAQYII